MLNDATGGDHHHHHHHHHDHDQDHHDHDFDFDDDDDDDDNDDNDDGDDNDVSCENQWLFKSVALMTIVIYNCIRPFQLLEYQMVWWVCRFDTLGKLVSAHRAGIHTTPG